MKSCDESTAQREGAGSLEAGTVPARAKLPAGAVMEKESEEIGVRVCVYHGPLSNLMKPGDAPLRIMLENM